MRMIKEENGSKKPEKNLIFVAHPFDMRWRKATGDREERLVSWIAFSFAN